MKRLRIALLCIFIFGAAASAGALGLSLYSRAVQTSRKTEDAQELPYFLRLVGSDLSVYRGGRTEGDPDARYPVELAALTSEDILELSCGIYYYDREEYLMALEGLGVD